MILFWGTQLTGNDVLGLTGVVNISSSSYKKVNFYLNGKQSGKKNGNLCRIWFSWFSETVENCEFRILKQETELKMKQTVNRLYTSVLVNKV